jgi:hypothetical protein
MYASNMPYPGEGASKAEIKKWEADMRAQSDLECLIAAAKIRLDPERYKAALGKRKVMLAELENIKA